MAPGQRYADETLNTLKFAMRAKHVRNKPAIRLDPHQVCVGVCLGGGSCLSPSRTLTQRCMGTGGGTPFPLPGRPAYVQPRSP